MEYHFYELSFVPLVSFGATLGSLRLPLGGPWAPLAMCWDPFDAIWAVLGRLLDLIANLISSATRCAKIIISVTHNDLLGIHMRFPRVQPVPRIPESEESGVIKCCSEPHFHTRRGQGYVSFTNSLKRLVVLLFWKSFTRYRDHPGIMNSLHYFLYL